MATAPNTGNYTIGKGVVSIQKVGETEWTMLGNAPTFSLNFESETLDHYSSMEGIKTMDLSVVLSRKAKLNIVLDEINEYNLSLALYGEANGGTIEGFMAAPVAAAIKFEGSNDIGNQYVYNFNKCTIIPTGTLALIGDSWMEIELEATVGADENGKFFTVSEILPTP